MTAAAATTAPAAVLTTIRIIRDAAGEKAPAAVAETARHRAAWLLELIEVHTAAGNHDAANLLVEERALWVQADDPAVAAVLLAIIDRPVLQLAEQLDQLEAARSSMDLVLFSTVFSAHQLALQLRAPEQYDRWSEERCLTGTAAAAFA